MLARGDYIDLGKLISRRFRIEEMAIDGICWGVLALKTNMRYT